MPFILSTLLKKILFRFLTRRWWSWRSSWCPPSSDSQSRTKKKPKKKNNNKNKTITNVKNNNKKSLEKKVLNNWKTFIKYFKKYSLFFIKIMLRRFKKYFRWSNLPIIQFVLCLFVCEIAKKFYKYCSHLLL